MIQKTFCTEQNKLSKKIESLRKDGWNIIAVITNTSPVTEPDAHGVSYGGTSIEIMCEREYQKPGILAGSKPWEMPHGRPCNPPRPGGY